MWGGGGENERRVTFVVEEGGYIALWPLVIMECFFFLGNVTSLSTYISLSLSSFFYFHYLAKQYTPFLSLCLRHGKHSPVQLCS